MNMKTSFIVGVSIIVAGVCHAAIVQPALPPASSGPTTGRFQIAGNPGHVYIIDTATGRVWEKYAAATRGSTSKGFDSEKIEAVP